MESGSSRVLARERLWGTRAGIAAIVGSILALVGFVLLQSALGGDTNYEGLVEAHEKSGTIWLSGVATAIGYALLTGPLLYLFRAAQARSPRVRNQFVGLVVIGPILLGLAGIGLAAGTQEAASSYLDGTAKSTLTPKEAREECAKERQDKGAGEFAEEFESTATPDPQRACVIQKREEDRASNAIRDSSFVTTSQFIGFAGGLSLVAALFYTGLWSMRTGLLSRFWGSLGMAVGIAALIGLTPLALIWFLYLGVLLLGRVPGGKPPAWEAGEAVPWPTAGQRAAAELEGPGDAPEELGPAEAGGAADADGAAEADETEGAADRGGERRKRKRRE